MNRHPLRIGVLGAGFISDYHLEGLQAVGAVIPILYSNAEASARRQAEGYGIPSWTLSAELVFERRDLDAVVIATPDFTHETLALAAIRAGKPALVQKPMARTSAECRRMVDAAEAANVPLYVSFMHRYFPEIEALRALLAEGTLGRVYSIRLRNATQGADWAPWFYQRDAVGGGVVLQLGVHGIDLLRHLFGEIEALSAATALMKSERRLADGTIVRPDNEDTALVTYRMASGALATHEIIYNEAAGTDRFRLEVYGERGTAWLRTERGPLAFSLEGGAWTAPPLPDESVTVRQHRHFAAMLCDEAPDDRSARDGLMSVQIAETIYRAAETGKWERVE
jgi:predicted dehydrogenase